MANATTAEIILAEGQEPSGSKGLLVIPSPGELIRLNYFDGKFLRAEDLELEQLYMRRLAALSNQTGGAGVVHGFSCVLGTGDSLNIGPGLAVDGQGRTLVLPQDLTVGLAELLEKSREASVPARVTEIGSATFGECELPASEVPGQVLDAASYYLVVVCHAEALCGEEDVYGKLCEEACVTSTDRPYVVEGVALRAVPLTLGTALTTSGTVTLTGKHLRSRVASAYFADEKARIAHLVSRADLESTAWCLGAEAAGGDCVPIALLARAGDSTLFLDAWTVRRERMEAPPQEYWHGRMAMRPWDVFLAQVLQFQCQLSRCLKESGDPGDEGPCAQALQMLRRTSETLVGMLKDSAGSPQFGQLQRMQGQLAAAVDGFSLVSGDRRLIDCGIVETPAAGYLPVVPSDDVAVDEQVRAWFGAGVDLRFCAVRSDFVPHALETAQHMDRISLLRGLDDPQNLEEVDVLVPDGLVVEEPVEPDTIVRGALSIGIGTDRGLPMNGGGRIHPLEPGGGSLCFAGVLRLDDLLTIFQVIGESGLGEPSAAKEWQKVFKGLPTIFPETYEKIIRAVETAEKNRDKASVLRQEVLDAQSGKLKPLGEAGAPEVSSLESAATPYSVAPGLEDLRIPLLATWIESRWEKDVFAVQQGLAPWSLRWILSVPIAQFVLDLGIDGALIVQQNTGNRVEGMFAGQGTLRVNDSVSTFPIPLPVQIDRTVNPDDVALTITFDPIPSSFVKVTITVVRVPALDVAATFYVGNFKLFTFTLGENRDALNCDTGPRNRAVEAITVLEHFYAQQQEVEVFDSAAALACILPPEACESVQSVFATRDWVLFHRRRTKECTENAVKMAESGRFGRIVLWQDYNGDRMRTPDELFKTDLAVEFVADGTLKTALSPEVTSLFTQGALIDLELAPTEEPWRPGAEVRLASFVNALAELGITSQNPPSVVSLTDAERSFLNADASKAEDILFLLIAG